MTEDPKRTKGKDSGYRRYLEDLTRRSKFEHAAITEAKVPDEMRATVRKEFRRWKEYLVEMIHSGSGVEIDGKKNYQFIFPNSLVSLVVKVIGAEQVKMLAMAAAREELVEKANEGVLPHKVAVKVENMLAAKSSSEAADEEKQAAEQLKVLRAELVSGSLKPKSN